MAKKMLVKSLLLLMVFEVLLVSASEARERIRSRRCDSSLPPGVPWVHSWQEYFTYSCPVGKTIKEWRSVHRNCKEDRVHYFGCESGPGSFDQGDCHWSGYVNNYDQRVSYTCPLNGFITGVASSYHGSHRDRKFDFRCCNVQDKVAHTCQTTTYQNSWDQELHYEVPNDFYMVGVISVHDNQREDRRYQFEICKFDEINYKA